MRLPLLSVFVLLLMACEASQTETSNEQQILATSSTEATAAITITPTPSSSVTTTLTATPSMTSLPMTATVTLTLTPTITATATLTPTPYPLTLNDTGISKCYDNFSELEDCFTLNFIGQDNNFGRDADALAGTLEKVGAGNAGFDFTKLDQDGSELANDALSHSCIRDNHTQLIWLTSAELANQSFYWYEQVDGEYYGQQSDQGCNLDSCTSSAAVSYINQVEQPLCGINTWRLPTTQELLSIVDYSQYSPPVDTHYFPHIGVGSLLSSDYAINEFGFNINVLSLDIGSITSSIGASKYNILLVRGKIDE